MIVTALPVTGNSSKFHVITKKGEFNMALSYTLKSKIWNLEDEAAELAAAHQLAEAIVSRHDPTTEYKPLYIFAEHNIAPSFSDALKNIRKYGLD